jgi:hypothetical protein
MCGKLRNLFLNDLWKISVFDYFYEKIAFFLAKPTKSMLETEISIKTQLKIEWKLIFVNSFQKKKKKIQKYL